MWLGLVVALAGFTALIAASLFAKAGPVSVQHHDSAGLVTAWPAIFGLGVMVIAEVIERVPAPLRSLGIRRPSLFDVIFGVLMFMLAASVLVAIVPTLNRYLPTTNAVSLDRLSMLDGWTLVFSAAIFEELFFRGYLIERFEMVTGRTWFAATASLVLFAVGHLPSWGAAGAARNFVWGAFVTALYLIRRNLLACMLMHFMQDTMVLPMLWYVPLKRMLSRLGY